MAGSLMHTACQPGNVLQKQTTEWMLGNGTLDRQHSVSTFTTLGHGGRASPLCMTTAAPPDSVPVCLAVERRLGPHNGIQCTLTDSSFTRVSVAIQFTSQVLPPSSENACSKRHESGVMSDQTFRTRMVLPLNDS